ncbi:MAG: ABC transporter permease, partial [Saprospiraceae bacterium]
MFKNNLKLAIRNLIKQRSYALINLFGLAIGLACTILIALWIQRELNVNQFHTHKDELFRVREHQTYGNDIYTYSSTPVPLADVLKADFPEITHVSRMDWGGRTMISRANGLGFYESGHYVDPDFLQMFSFPLLQGDAASALTEPTNIIISEELAAKYFANENPLGQILTLNNKDEYTVSAVLKTIPEASTINFDFLIPFEQFIAQNSEDIYWNNNMVQTYFRTVPNTDAAHISKKIANLVVDNGQSNVELLAHPLKDWYLRANFKDKKIVGGNIERVRLFGIIAIFILLIAGINFVNLVTAKSVTRAKEVGVRKVMGATRGSLVGQFLFESVILTCLAGGLSLAMLSFTLPYFNTIFKLELSLLGAGMSFWATMAAIVLATGLLAGIYPSAVMTKFRPTQVLKNQLSTGSSGVRLRKILVTAQFVISILLIISTIIVYQQVELIKNQDLGYTRENLLQIRLNSESYEEYDILKNQLAQIPEVLAVSSTSQSIHSWGSNTSGVSWEGKDPESNILFQTIPTDYDFINTIGATLDSGRDFSPSFADSTSFIINKTAAKAMGLEDPVGKTISLSDTEGQIVGLATDTGGGSSFSMLRT